MRILHVSPNYYPALGGSDFHIKELSERLAARGHQVTVITLDDWTAAGRGNARAKPKVFESLNSVNVRRVKPDVRLYRCFTRLLKVRGSHRALGLVFGTDRVQMLSITPLSLKIFAQTIRSSADVVGVINWYHSTLAYQCCLARKINRIPLVGIPLFHTERMWSRSQIYPGMLARCDAVLANTDHERNYIAGLVPGHKRVHVTGVGVDPQVFSDPDAMAVRIRYGIGKASVIGYLGRIAANKGVAKLIESMKIVWRTDSQARLVLAGSGFPPLSSDPEIISAFDGLSRDENSRVIRISEFTEQEKPAILSAFDVLAMPSVAESFGIVYLEAWMCNKPVIGARIGSTRDVIQDGVDGLLVNPDEPGDIARAILELLGDPAKRERMGTSGRSKTLARFTWDKVTDKVETIYRDLAGQK